MEDILYLNSGFKIKHSNVYLNFGMSKQEIHRLLNQKPKNIMSTFGIISLKYGVGTYQEDSEEEICESIIIFKKGYYDSIYG